MRPATILFALGTVAALAGLGVSRISHLGVQQGYAPAQPIAFSHRLHAGDNQVPCLYCHYGARKSRHAGVPSPSICMNCHAMLERQTVEIEKLAEAVLIERPIIAWVKVHNLPDFVYFNHSRHFIAGVACQRCHGDVAHMERIEQVAPLTMGWCLDCHREHAGVPTSTLRRAAKRLAGAPPTAPAAALNCVSCHY